MSPVLCAECDCDYRGSVSEECDAAGRCVCRQGVEGPRCDRCRPGLHAFPHCQRPGERAGPDHLHWTTGHYRPPLTLTTVQTTPPTLHYRPPLTLTTVQTTPPTLHYRPHHQHYSTDRTTNTTV
ncbi:hypothetical protein CRUP_035792 [Coryphaenoides rupestris]|nr:hypothetical protein CRUP_035792 [Coryphaenoides rupestris]